MSPDTTVRFERDDKLKERIVEAIQAALEGAGVIFVPGNGEGPGVRLRRTDIHADLTLRRRIEDHIASSKISAKPSPEAGMQMLEKARKKNAVTKLKNRQAKLKRRPDIMDAPSMLAGWAPLKRVRVDAAYGGWQKIVRMMGQIELAAA